MGRTSNAERAGHFLCKATQLSLKSRGEWLKY